MVLAYNWVFCWINWVIEPYNEQLYWVFIYLYCVITQIRSLSGALHVYRESLKRVWSGPPYEKFWIHHWKALIKVTDLPCSLDKIAKKLKKVNCWIGWNAFKMVYIHELKLQQIINIKQQLMKRQDSIICGQRISLYENKINLYGQYQM